MLATDDVVNLVREAGVFFVDEAILTTPSRALGNLRSYFLVDITRHERRSGGHAPLPFSKCVRVP